MDLLPPPDRFYELCLRAVDEMTFCANLPWPRSMYAPIYFHTQALQFRETFLGGPVSISVRTRMFDLLQRQSHGACLPLSILVHTPLCSGPSFLFLNTPSTATCLTWQVTYNLFHPSTDLILSSPKLCCEIPPRMRVSLLTTARFSRHQRAFFVSSLFFLIHTLPMNIPGRFPSNSSSFSPRVAAQ